jgi:hypothetical protein
MDKKNEELLEETVEKFKQSAKQTIDKFFEEDGKETLNIDKIEQMWGVLRMQSDQAIQNMFNEMAGQTGEKELLRKKKEN